MAGFVYAPFGDLEATRRLVDDETAAILVEPVQGEGGVVLPPDGFLQGLRELGRSRMACYSCSTKCKPAAAAPANGSRTNIMA